MEKYLEILNKIIHSESNSFYMQLLKKIESYVKGEITPEELVQDATDNDITIIYRTINKLLNYKEKEIKYYIPLPQDIYFNHLGSMCILASRSEDFSMVNNSLQAVGPECILSRGRRCYEENYCEISGDFSKYPNGVMLFESDWYRIIAKYPNLYEMIQTFAVSEHGFNSQYTSIEHIKSYVDNRIALIINAQKNGEPCSHWEDKEEAQYIPQEIIDSIQFITPIQYLAFDHISSGNFGTFKELAESKRGDEVRTKDLSEDEER